MLILVCNAGSTSLKYKLFDMPSDDILVEAKQERVGRHDAIFSYKDNISGFNFRNDCVDIPDYTAGIQLFLSLILDKENGRLEDISALDAVGFKTVLAKGYPGVHELTDDVIHAMEQYITVAPSHNPPYIEAVKVFKELLPGKLLVGCFETAFHRTIPLSRRLYALPYEWYEKYGIQRFGYHGASHGYISRKITEIAGEKYRLVSCHLGGSGSVCAIQNGASVDTSFGFSLQTGLPHANRSGDVDAYIIPYLLSEGLTMEEIIHGIDKEGGLKGISGISNDLREIEQAADSGNSRAKLAIDVFSNAIIKYIGSFYTELGGMDYLVFTGGIGENSALIREKVCEKLECLGVMLERDANSALHGQGEISSPSSKVKVLVIPANEEVGIAKTIYENFRA